MADGVQSAVVGGLLGQLGPSVHQDGHGYLQLDFRCVWTVENIPDEHSVAFVIDDMAMEYRVIHLVMPTIYSSLTQLTIVENLLESTVVLQHQTLS